MQISAPVGDDCECPVADSGRRWMQSGLIRRFFSDQTVEQLYQKDRQRCKESHLDCFLTAVVLVAAHSTVSVSLTLSAADDHDPPPWASIVLSAVSGTVALVQSCLCLRLRCWLRPTVAAVQRLTCAAWLLANVLILSLLLLPHQARLGPAAPPLTWLLLVNFLTCVTLPLRLLTCLVLAFVASVLFVTVSAAAAAAAATAATATTYGDHHQLTSLQQVRPLSPSLCRLDITHTRRSTRGSIKD